MVWFGLVWFGFTYSAAYQPLKVYWKSKFNPFDYNHNYFQRSIAINFLIAHFYLTIIIIIVFIQRYVYVYLTLRSPVGWVCEIHRLHLCIEVRLLPNKFLDRTLNHLMSNHLMARLQIWGIWNTPSLPLLPRSLWPGVVAPDRVISQGQIEQTMCENKWLMLNCDCYIAMLETI